ncbi:MAG: transglutaminaseTgpA domain-containing protein [Pirellulaceae bacterium]|nr:transglutaminaseTgpA domain-containing protein [Pirellulaceae bacterium]
MDNSTGFHNSTASELPLHSASTQSGSVANRLSAIERAEGRLQLSLAVTVTFGAFLLAIGQQLPWMATFALFGGLGSYILNDRLRLFYLNRWLANTLGIGAVIFAITDMFTYESFSQMLAVAKLLVFLQVILLFEKKTSRSYPQLLLLSLLQMVVVGAMDLGVEIGAAFLFHLFFAMLTMVQLLIFNLHYKFSVCPDGQTVHFVVGGDNRSRKTLHRASLSKAEATKETGERVGQPGSKRRRKNPKGEMAHFAFRWSFLFVFLVLPVAGGFMFTVPRVEALPQKLSELGEQVVGLSDQINLGEEEEIIESQETALRVQFLDEQGDFVEVDEDQIYLRGTTLSNYYPGINQRRSGWRKYLVPEGVSNKRLGTPPSGNLVEQKITLFDTHLKNVVFAFPAYKHPDEEKTLYSNTQTMELFIQNEEKGSERRYSLYTDSIDPSGNFRDIVPYANPQRLQFTQAEELRLLSHFPRDPLPTAHRIASDLKDDLSSSATQYELAKYYESYFLKVRDEDDPDRFIYTLDQTAIPHDELTDPTEEFLKIHRSGHCEYFASSLALMLRSQGIPTRVVSGYRGGDYNTVGSYYVVKQANAHSWVEAYLPSDQLPASYQNDPRFAEGGWLRLDPTPSTTDSGESEVVSAAFDVFEFMGSLWGDYVSPMFSVTARERLLSDLGDRLEAWGNDTFSLREWRLYIDDQMRRLGFYSGNDENPLWRYLMLILAIVVVVILASGYYFIKALFAKHLERGQKQKAKERLYRPVEFYQRWEKTLKQFRLLRNPAQTQKEFAVELENYFSENRLSTTVVALPQQMVALFYQVRFGDDRLSEKEGQSIEQGLDELKKSLSHLTRSGKGNSTHMNRAVCR